MLIEVRAEIEPLHHVMGGDLDRALAHFVVVDLRRRLEQDNRELGAHELEVAREEGAGDSPADNDDIVRLHDASITPEEAPREGRARTLPARLRRGRLRPKSRGPS